MNARQVNPSRAYHGSGSVNSPQATPRAWSQSGFFLLQRCKPDPQDFLLRGNDHKSLRVFGLHQRLELPNLRDRQGAHQHAVLLAGVHAFAGQGGSCL